MKTATRFTATLVTLVLVLLFTVTTSSAATSILEPGDLAIINADTFLNLRDKPQGEIIGKIPHGDIITIKSKVDRNGYYKVYINRTGETGYAYGEYLSLYKTSNGNDDYTVPTIDGLTKGATLVVTVDTWLNLRENPNINSRIISYLYNGVHLQVMSEEIKNDYILVYNTSTRIAGYVHIDYVKVVDENTSTDYECCPDCKYCKYCRSQQW